MTELPLEAVSLGSLGPQHWMQMCYTGACCRPVLCSSLPPLIGEIGSPYTGVAGPTGHPHTAQRGIEGAASWVFLLAISLGQHRTNSWLSSYGSWRASLPTPLSLSSLLSCGRVKTHGGWTQTSNTWLDPMSPCRVNNSHPLCCSQEGQFDSNFLGFDCYTRPGFLSFKCGWLG